jgi:hypothetical protein
MLGVDDVGHGLAVDLDCLRVAAAMRASGQLANLSHASLTTPGTCPFPRALSRSTRLLTLFAVRGSAFSQQSPCQASGPYCAKNRDRTCRASVYSRAGCSPCPGLCDALAISRWICMPRNCFSGDDGHANCSHASSVCLAYSHSARNSVCASGISDSPRVACRNASAPVSFHIVCNISRSPSRPPNPISHFWNSIGSMVSREVQPRGQPINISTHVGFSAPPLDVTNVPFRLATSR